MHARHLRSVAVGLALGTALLLPASPAAADVDDFTFDSFHADMQLSRASDGHAELEVVETIIARFPDEDQNRGIVRAIPDDADDVPMQTSVVSVTDGDGNDVPFEIERDGDFLEVATGDDAYVRGVQTYVITYTQRDSIRSYTDTDADEFYRDINGTGWEQPFGEVSVDITVDADLVDALNGNAACYAGEEGSSDRCTLDIAEGSTPGSEPSVFRASAGPFEEGENLTVAVGFDKGTFVPGEVQRSAVEQFAIDAEPGLRTVSIVAALAGVGAMIAAFVARFAGRDARGRGTIIAQYAPPEGISIIQAAHLVNRAATTAMPAAIVDLAVAGHLRLIEHDDDFSLEYVGPSPHDAERQRVLDELFGPSPAPGTMVHLGGDTVSLAKRLDTLSTAGRGELRTAGLTEARRPIAAWLALGLAVVAVLVSVALLIFAAVNEVAGAVIIGAAVITGFAAIVAVIAWPYRDRVTDRGAEVRDHLIGLRDYLRLAETDRIRMLQSPRGAERTGPDGAEMLHLYERLLPYAIIWGVEKEWAQVLETRAAESGTGIGWYNGPNGFTSAYFLTSLGATRNSTTSAAWSSSSSGSSSGGSTGGGFSGGGFGGGGGGGR